MTQERPAVWVDGEQVFAGECLVHKMHGKTEDTSTDVLASIPVYMEYRDHCLVLTSSASAPHTLPLPLCHRVADGGCPMLAACRAPQLAADVAALCAAQRAARVACSVLVVCDSHVLLTRRPATMRSFPCAWVPPGGMVDVGDATLADAALRELHEEVGLDVAGATLTPLCLWESSAGGDGVPTSLTLVVFYVLRMDGFGRDAFLRDTTFSHEEVDAACWVDGRHLCADAETEAEGEGREAGVCVGATVAGVAVHGSSPGAVTPAVFALDTLRPPYAVKGCGLSAAPQRALEMYFSRPVR